MYRSRGVPWRTTCKRRVDQVYIVFMFGCESWSWSRQASSRGSRRRRYVGTVGWVLQKKKKIGRGAGNRAAHVSLAEYELVDEYESPRHDGGPKRSHQMEAQMELAQSWTCLGQVCTSMGRGRGLDRKEEEVLEQDWYERFRGFRPDECETLNCTQTNIKNKHKQTRKERSQEESCRLLDKTMSVGSERTNCANVRRWQGRRTWINGKEFSERIGGVKKTQHSWWKTGVAYTVLKIGDYVKHTHRERNQEEITKVMVEGFTNTEPWNAIGGYCDCSNKKSGSSGCSRLEQLDHCQQNLCSSESWHSNGGRSGRSFYPNTCSSFAVRNNECGHGDAML